MHCLPIYEKKMQLDAHIMYRKKLQMDLKTNMKIKWKTS